MVPRPGRVGHLEDGRLYRLEIGNEPRHLVIEPRQWAEEKKIVLRLWADDPLPPPCPHERACCEAAHGRLPKTLGKRRTIASQSSFAPKRITDQPQSSTQLLCSRSRACRVGNSWCGPST